MMIFQLALILALSAASAASKVTTDPLQCLMDSFSYIFDEIDIDLDGKTLTISDLTCSSLGLSGLPSAYRPPTTLSLAADGLAISCSGNYKYGLLRSSVAMNLLTDITLDLLITKSNDLPVSSNFSACNLTKFDLQIDFQSPILNAFAPFIAGLVEQTMYRVVCETMNSAYSTAVDKVLTKINPVMVNVSASTPDPWPVYNKRYIDWNNSTYSALRNMLDSLTTSTDIPDFLQCMSDKDLSKRLATAPGLLDGSDFQHLWEDVTEEAAELLSQPIEILPGLSIELMHAKFRGLDTLSDLQVLAPLEDSQVVLRSSMAFAALSVDLRVKLMLNTSMLIPGCAYYEEELMFSFAVADNSLIADLVVAADGHLLDSFKMDQLASPACWASILTEISIPNLAFAMGLTDISLVQVRGDSAQLEADLVALLDNMLTFLVAPEAFHTLTEMLVTGLAQGPLREGLDKQLGERLQAYQSAHPCLSHYPYDDEQAYITWPSAKEISALADLVNKQIGYQGVNELMFCATNGTGKLSVQSGLFLVELSGLNSFYGLELFGMDADRPYNLQTALAVGYCPNGPEGTDCNPLALSLALNPETLLRRLLGPAQAVPSAHNARGVLGAGMLGLSLNRTVHVVLSVENLALFADTAMKVDKNKLKDLAYGQLATTGCKASSVETMVFDTLELNASHAELVLKDGAVDKNITTGIQKMLSFMTSQDAIDGKNADIADALYAAEPTCVNGGVNPLVVDPTAPDDAATGDEFLGVDRTLFIVLVCLIGLPCAMLWWKTRHCWESADEEEDEKVCGANGQTARSGDLGESFFDRHGFQEALLFHKDIPLAVRLGVFVGIFFCAGLFFDADVMEKHAVQIMVEILTPTASYSAGDVFNFSLGGTLTDMWYAEVWTLAVLITVFSAAGPFVKLFVLLFAWCLPPSWLSSETRTRMLFINELLSKWMCINVFVMILWLCAFYFILPVIPGVSAVVTVKPMWGIYAFLLACFMNFMLGHIVTAYHRAIVHRDGDSKTESLVSLVYEVEALDWEGVAQEKVLVRTTVAGQVVLMLSIVIAAGCIVLGTMAMTMRYEFQGLIGLMLGDDAVNDYSILSVGQAIPEHSGIPQDAGAIWMQISYFLLVIAMPLVLLIALSVLWFVPMSCKQMHAVFTGCEMVNCWCSLDVYCIAIAAATAEIRQFAAYILRDFCGGLEVYLTGAILDNKLQGNDVCFDVVASYCPAAWLLYLGAGLLVLISVPSLMVGHAAINMRSRDVRTISLQGRQTDVDVTITEPLLQEADQAVAASADEPSMDSLQGEERPSAVSDSRLQQASGRTSLMRSSGSTLTGKARRRAERADVFWKWFRWNHNKLQLLHALGYLKLLHLEAHPVAAEEEEALLHSAHPVAPV